jgi:hypothetical protein
MCEDRKTVCPALLRFDNRLTEGQLHQRIEAAHRLVENEQAGTFGERPDELDFLPIPLRERTGVLRRAKGNRSINARRSSMSTEPCVRPRNSSVSSPVGCGQRYGSPAVYASRRCVVAGSCHALSTKTRRVPRRRMVKASNSLVVVVFLEPFGPRSHRLYLCATSRSSASSASVEP